MLRGQSREIRIPKPTYKDLRAKEAELTVTTGELDIASAAVEQLTDDPATCESQL